LLTCRLVEEHTKTYRDPSAKPISDGIGVSALSGQRLPCMTPVGRVYVMILHIPVEYPFIAVGMVSKGDEGVGLFVLKLCWPAKRGLR
jgi:hypothetical protein